MKYFGLVGLCASRSVRWVCVPPSPSKSSYFPFQFHFNYKLVAKPQRRRRHDNFKGTEHDYILHLESRIGFLEYHHRECVLNIRIPLLSPPPSSIASGEEVQSDIESSPARTSSRRKRSFNESNIEFIRHEFSAIQNPVIRRSGIEQNILGGSGRPRRY